jgi:hypothetical protein
MSWGEIPVCGEPQLNLRRKPTLRLSKGQSCGNARQRHSAYGLVPLTPALSRAGERGHLPVTRRTSRLLPACHPVGGPAGVLRR